MTKPGCWFKTLLAALMLLLGMAAHAARAELPATVLTEQARSVRVESGIEMLVEDEGQPLTRDMVNSAVLAERWQVHKGKKINLTRQPKPVWFRFTLNNQAGPAKRWLLAIEWPLLEQIEMHQFDPARSHWVAAYRTGTDWPAEQKLLKDSTYMFPLDIPEGKSVTLLMRVQTSATFFVPLVVYEAKAYQQQRYDHAIWMGVLMGVLSIMLVYNASLALFTRERSYMFYALYLLAVLCYELTVTGLGALYVWSSSPWLKGHGYELFATLSFCSAVVFFRYFLDLKSVKASLYRLNTWLVVYWAGAFVLSIVWPSKMLSLSIGVTGLVTSVVGVYTSVYLLAQGNVSARYFALAWFSVIVGTVAVLLSLMGVVEGNWFTNNAQHIGFVIEISLLSVALADRIKRERLVRERAQLEALDLTQKIKEEREEKIRAQEHAIEVQQQANEDLELRVLDRTAELERAMRNLEIANIELSKLSVTDGLTKVHNRRYFDETLKKEYDRSARTLTPLALIMADIDNFKKINDSCGHLAGDECLRLVAAAMRNTVGRSTDMIARYGGEEFAIVLPATGPEQALEVADRVRRAIEEIDFIYRGKRIALSISLGVVAKVATLDQSLGDFVAQADAALYRAKDNGRNRVEAAAA
jgi:two-component system, sensor histidine kinase LadS